MDKSLFDSLSSQLFESLGSDELATTNLKGEVTNYCRYNGGRVRQNTHVNQYFFSFRLIKGARHLKLSFSLGEDPKLAREKLNERWLHAKSQIEKLPEDPHPPLIQNNGNSDHHDSGQLPNDDALLKEVPTMVEAHDFCGLAASGLQVSANQNSLGQKHWFSRESFFLDYSLYAGDRAVKSGYAGTQWLSSSILNNIAKASQQLEKMKMKPINVKPGKYRVYMAPEAVGELVDFLSWFAFSQRAFQTGGGFFTDLGRGLKKLNKDLHISENFALGLSPRFNEFGEISPEKIDLIKGGELNEWLTSTSSAKEFNVSNNFASQGERPRSIEIKPGHLKPDDILKELDTGLYLSNLHYVNASDLKTARLTGMTRYACFWVEKGEIIGPIENLRFDESLYEAWGPKLLGVSAHSELIPNVSTYEARALGGSQLPGMLVDDFSFTL